MMQAHFLGVLCCRAAQHLTHRSHQRYNKCISQICTSYWDWAHRNFCSVEQPQQGSMWSEVRRLEGNPRDAICHHLLYWEFWRPYQYPWASLFKENVEKIEIVRHLLYISKVHIMAQHSNETQIPHSKSKQRGEGE